MNRNQELVKNTAILSIGKLGTQIVQFLLLPLYTALLTQEEYGIVDLFNTYITLLLPIFNWQFDSGLFRFLIERRGNENKQKKLISTVFFSHIIQVLGYLIFYSITQRYIESPYKIFLALDVVVNIFLNSMLQVARGRGKNTEYAMASFLSLALAAIFNVAFLVGFQMGALGLFLSTLIAKVITVIYLIFSQKIWRFFDATMVNRDDFVEVLHYSLPMIPNSLSWWVISASDRTIISKFLSISANGIYSVANKFPAFFISIYNVFNMAWTETVALHINDEDRDAFLTEAINSVFKFFSFICIGIIACMPFVFPYMVNKEFSESYYQIPILIAASLFQVLVGLYSAIYIALKETKAVAKTSMVVAIVNLAVDLALIPFIKLYAASISTLIAFLVMAIYRSFDIKRYVNVSLNRNTVAKVVVVGGATIISYYINCFLISVMMLVLVGIMAVKENMGFLKEIPTLLKRKHFGDR